LKAIKIIVTEDGSHSLLNEDMNETYHSRHGAMQESVYVFISKGLDFLQQRENLNTISILEIGFGTGLNAWLSLEWATDKNKTIKYHSLETFPVPQEIWESLNYSSKPDATDFKMLHRTPWQTWNEINPVFSLFKDNQSLQEITLPPNHFELIYFDAFAPNKQPEMWELPLLSKVVASMKSEGVFVTYCAKGQLKRDLKTLGLVVESLPGPPGKREMIRAVKN
jgi:tRNA U34 5-methylaminomethyl-2-thiouridine-forming methyltransferase MnmC